MTEWESPETLAQRAGGTYALKDWHVEVLSKTLRAAMEAVRERCAQIAERDADTPERIRALNLDTGEVGP